MQTLVIIHAFIIGRLDYCNSLLYGLPSVHLSKLQCVQNSAAKLVCNISRYDHITPVLYSLHWLLVQYRIRFKILILTFKAIHGLLPEYISNLISVKVVSKYSLSSNGGLLLNQPSTRLWKTEGTDLLHLLPSTLGNKLPAHLRNMDNFINYKFSLKTHLFRTAF